MDRSAILRFSDAEKPTIPEHSEVIGTRFSVWWGWWKKQTEQFPLEVLRYLKSESRRRPLQIGLVKRKDEEELYTATCIDVAFEESGSPIMSPDPELTPGYYRGTEFPAWFKLSKIRQIDRRNFLRQFGFVPTSDPTFYDVFQDAEGEFGINPRPSWSMEIVKAPGDAILHLSDLHFGSDYGFPLVRPIPGRGMDALPLVEKISSRIFQELGIRVGVVVVSGDLITRGLTDAYPYVRSFLESLLDAFDLEPRHCVIVPGNHDLWTEGVDHPSRDYRHELPYRMFLDAVFGTKLQDLERVRRYQTPSGFELIFVELNSARLRSDELREYGYVSKHRYSELLRFVTDVLKQDTNTPAARLKFAVLHHHLMPVGGVETPDGKKPVSVCLDAGELISEFQAHGFHFVLHGHEHTPFVGTVGTVARVADRSAPDGALDFATTPKPMFVLACGSSGACRVRLPEEFDQNIFGLYQPMIGGLQVTFEQYTQFAPCRPLWKVSLPVS